MVHANDLIEECTCTESYYKTIIKNFYHTDGVKTLCDKFECFWFLDIVVSYQPELKGQEFQVWELERKGNSATVICHDGNDNQLVKQEIPFTDFEPDTAVIWVEGNVALLPTEH